MSVHVVIEDAGKNFRRELVIELTSDAHADKDGLRDREEVGTYAVVAAGQGLSRPAIAATFTHRYGDDVYTLVHEAITALGIPVDGMTGRR